jgi:hypothetical protein
MVEAATRVEADRHACADGHDRAVLDLDQVELGN